MDRIEAESYAGEWDTRSVEVHCGEEIADERSDEEVGTVRPKDVPVELMHMLRVNRLRNRGWSIRDETKWNLRLGTLLLEAVPVDVINLIRQDLPTRPERWTGEFILRKLWETGLSWMTQEGSEESLFYHYLSFLANPGKTETLGILQAKLHWWAKAKKFFRAGRHSSIWIGGRKECLALHNMLGSLLRARSIEKEPVMGQLWSAFEEYYLGFYCLDLVTNWILNFSILAMTIKMSRAKWSDQSEDEEEYKYLT